MEQRGWLSSLISPAVTLAGRPSQVVAGMLATEGGRQIAARIGDMEPVILPPQACAELITHLRQLLEEKLRHERDTP